MSQAGTYGSLINHLLSILKNTSLWVANRVDVEDNVGPIDMINNEG